MNDNPETTNGRDQLGAPPARPASGGATRRSVLSWGLSAVAAAAAAPTMAACSSSSNSGVSANGEVTLKVMGFEVDPSEKGSALDKAYQAFLADFRAKHPHIKIQSLQTPPDFATQIITQLASGTAPDLWEQDASSLAPLVQRNLLLDMRKCIRAVPALKPDRFFPQVLDIHKAKNGALYGIPNDFTPMVVYYNPEVFAKSHVQPPQPGWTWDDQLRLAQQLTLDDKGRNRLDPNFDESHVAQWGYCLDSHAYKWVYRVWQNGSDVISPDYKTTSGYLNSPATVAAIQWYSDLVLKHKVAPPPTLLSTMTNASDTDTLFVNGKFAMMDSGHWELVGLALAKGFSLDKIAVVPQPAKVTQATALYESSFVSPSNLPDAKITAIAQLVEAATGRKYQDTKAITGIALSATEAAAQAAARNPHAKFPHLDQAFIEATAHGRAPYGSKIPQYPTIEPHLDSMMDAILRGASVQTQISQTIATANRELQTT